MKQLISILSLLVLLSSTTIAQTETTSESVNICAGDPITLSAAPLTDAGNQYIWSTGATMEHIPVRPLETTTYSVTVTSTEKPGCRSIATIEVIVKPIVDIEIIAEGDVCNFPVVLTAPEGYTYTWRVETEDGEIETIEGNSHQINALTGGTYYASVTTDNEVCEVEASITLEESGITSAEIKAYFEDNGFISVPIAVVPEGGTIRTTGSSSRSSGEDLPGITLFDDEPAIDIAAAIDNFASCTDGTDFSNFTTSNASVCSADFLNNTAAEFDAAGSGIWSHVFEDENGQGILYVKGKNENGPGVSETAQQACVDNAIDLVKKLENSPADYGFDSKGEQAINVVNQIVATSSLSGECPLIGPVDETTQKACEESDMATVGLSPAGLPIILPENTILRYGLPASLSDKIDSRALTGFTLNQDIVDIYHGIVRTNKVYGTTTFAGYRSMLSSCDNTFYETPTDFDNSTQEVLLGNYSTGTYGEEDGSNCKIYTTFIGLYTVNETNEGASGSLAPDFEEAGLQSIEEGSESINYICPPTFTVGDLNDPSIITSRPEANLVNPNVSDPGWSFSMKTINPATGKEETIPFYGYTDPVTGGFKFYRYECGRWISTGFTDEQLNALGIFYSILNTIKNNADIHTILDVIGVVPMFGEIADLTNGIIFLAEGDNTNAFISFAASIPFIGIEIIGGKYTIKLAGDAKATSNIASTYTEEVIDVYTLPDGTSTVDVLQYIGKWASSKNIPTDQGMDLANFLLAPGNANILKRFNENPQLFDIWKKYSDRSFCPLSGGVLDSPIESTSRSSQCKDLSDVLASIKDASVDFWGNFLKFGDDQIIDFLTDLNGYEGLLEEMLKRPDLIKGWDFIYGSSNIRKWINDDGEYYIALVTDIITDPQKIDFLNKWGAAQTPPLSPAAALDKLKEIMNDPNTSKRNLIRELANANSAENYAAFLNNNTALQRNIRRLADVNDLNCLKCAEYLKDAHKLRANEFKYYRTNPEKFLEDINNYPSDLIAKMEAELGGVNIRNLSTPYDPALIENIKNLSLEKWTAVFKGYEAHHIFPKSLFIESMPLRDYLKYIDGVPFDFNGHLNAIFVQQNRHGFHNAYNEHLETLIDQLMSHVDFGGMIDSAIKADLFEDKLKIWGNYLAIVISSNPNKSLDEIMNKVVYDPTTGNLIYQG